MPYIYKPDRSLVKVEKWSDYDFEEDGRLLVPYCHFDIPYGKVDYAYTRHIFFYNTKTGNDRQSKEGFSLYRGDIRTDNDFMAVAVFEDWNPDSYTDVPVYRWGLMNSSGRLITSMIYREVLPPLSPVRDARISVKYNKKVDGDRWIGPRMSRSVYVFVNFKGQYGVFDMLEDDTDADPVVSFGNEFRKIDGFKYGLARAAVLDETPNLHVSWDIPPLLYGILDTKGRWRVKPRYKYMGSFYNKESPWDLMLPVASEPPPHEWDEWALKQYVFLHNCNPNIPYPDMDKVLKQEREDEQRMRDEAGFNDSYDIRDALDYDPDAIWNLPDY